MPKSIHFYYKIQTIRNYIPNQILIEPNPKLQPPNSHLPVTTAPASADILILSRWFNFRKYDDLYQNYLHLFLSFSGRLLKSQICLETTFTILMNDVQKSSNVFKQPNEERNDVEAQQVPEKKEENDSVSFFGLFRFADRLDYFLMIFGSLGGLGLGASTPIFILFWGQFTDVFGTSADAIVEQAKQVLIKFAYVGTGSFIAGSVMIIGWLITGERQAAACRKAYFSHLLKQQIGWFDCINQAELSSSFSSETNTYQGALGEKVAIVMQMLGTAIGGLAVAFSQGWLMSLVCLAGFPVIVIAGYVYMRQMQIKTKQLQKIYSRAGGMAEQAFYSIKTVKQLNGEEYEQKVFHDCLAEVKEDHLKFGIKTAFSNSLMQSSMFLLFSLGYWFGSTCAEGNSSCPPSISGHIYTPGQVVTVFFSVLVACVYFSQLSPALKKISEGKQAAASIYKILDREPTIKNAENPLIPESFHGRITFQNVTFAYPKDPKRTILDNISIQFDISNTALVGDSGCGKSTILQLIMRFYDPNEGRVLLDGNDIRELDLVWLRNKIGYVGQEPVLFATSIRENLLLGNETATTEQIDAALREAEAYDFIYNQLENKLDTYVGSGGGQISGGQKQRIAIARALLKNPKILLLDEATSALDRRNEKLIQKTLNNISQGLTTVTVAHRVKTVMDAEMIYVIERGRILEKGKFGQLERYKNFADDAEAEEDVEDLGKAEAKAVRKPSTHEKKEEEKKEVNPLIEKEKKEKKAAQDKELIAKHEKGIFRRVFGYLETHRLSFFFGIILTLAIGCVFPVFSIFLSNIINSLFKLATLSTQSEGRHEANIASLVFLLLAIGICLTTMVRDFLTFIVGGQITTRIRKQLYQKILKMPISWFDHPDNNVGILSTRLGTDCQTINGMATTYVYIMIQSFATLLSGIILALVFEWRTALVALGLMPLIVLAGAIRAKVRNGQMEQQEIAYKDSAQIVMESLTNIRTVVSFGVQNTVLHKYEKGIDGPQQMLIRTSVCSGIFYGLSQIINFMVFGIIFYLGAIFMKNYGVTLLDVFTAAYEIFFAGITVGNNSHFLPDMNEAKLAASHIFEILDSEDEEQIQAKEGSQMLTDGIKGNIVLKDVSFKYENRKQYVFKNMNIQIKPGQKIAFVGPSGCGKSTIMQLLQRFYNQQSGSITIDGIDIKNFDIHYLRSKFGVVSQEPMLFNASFRDNIRYNKDTSTEEEIRNAARMANAISFIEGDERIEMLDKAGNQMHVSGFDRNVGLKGSHISGGQKQRVAIARAILRDPQILLLDEATSALDAQNERKVQQSLDRIMQSKTTITIAHRIDTIKNADQIYVFQKGEIVQSGSYQQLLSLRGFFFNLERGTQFL